MNVAKNAGMASNYIVANSVPNNTLSITNLTAGAAFQIMDEAKLLTMGTLAGTNVIDPQEANDDM